MTQLRPAAGGREPLQVSRNVFLSAHGDRQQEGQCAQLIGKAYSPELVVRRWELLRSCFDKLLNMRKALKLLSESARQLSSTARLFTARLSSS